MILTFQQICRDEGHIKIRLSYDEFKDLSKVDDASFDTYLSEDKIFLNMVQPQGQPSGELSDGKKKMGLKIQITDPNTFLQQRDVDLLFTYDIPTHKNTIFNTKLNCTRLSITKMIVENLNGTINCTSTKEQGT